MLIRQNKSLIIMMTTLENRLEIQIVCFHKLQILSANSKQTTDITKRIV